MPPWPSVFSYLQPQNFSNFIFCGDFNIDWPYRPRWYQQLCLDTDFKINSSCTRITSNNYRPCFDIEYNHIYVVWKQWNTTFLDVMKLSIPHRTVPRKCSTHHTQQEFSRHGRFYRMLKIFFQPGLASYKYLQNNMICSSKNAFEQMAHATTICNTRKYWSILTRIKPRNTTISGQLIVRWQH